MAESHPNGPYFAKRVTATGVISTANSPGYVKAFGLTGATAASSVTLKDGGTDGTALLELKIDSSVAANANRTVSSGDIGPVRFETDIFATLAGTGAVAWVVFNEDQDL